MKKRHALALAQHPMYFIIKEDTGCAERTPPWGAPSVQAYAERLERNLSSLERYPNCRFGYEWSGYELELLANEFPEVFEKMRALGDAGNTAFYNGTYSQPHLQTLSSESCFRQFNYGMAVYEKLGLRSPITYAHQEASVQDQVPQLLSAFGQRYAVIPGFSSTIEWIEHGEVTVRWGAGLKFVSGAEFTSWVGLDGSTIPLYLINGANAPTVKESVTIDIMQDLMGGPSISLAIPDLIEVDETWLNEMAEVDLVTLDDALAERIQTAPPVGSARFYSNWSYIEGIRAEELSRANLAAETALLSAASLGACAYVLVNYEPPKVDELWKTVLACQHHDVYCFCAPELKGKAVGWLAEITAKASQETDNAVEAIAAEISLPQGWETGISVFNTNAAPYRGVVEAVLPHGVSEIIDTRGNSKPFDVVNGTDGSTTIRFLAEIPGLGYSTYPYRPGETAVLDPEPCGPDGMEFQNEYYRASVNGNGAFTSLVLHDGDAELLDTTALSGNTLAGTDSEGLSPRGTALGREGQWDRPERGAELEWIVSRCEIEKGLVETTFRAYGTLCSTIDAQLELIFCRESPLIRIVWVFDFDESSVGNFYEDETKLRVCWPLAFKGSVSHDIGFGVIDERENRPFTPASWTDISDGTRGFAYLHRGTPKHWVSDQVLHNLFAWGEFTEAIGSRMWRHNWMKCFDQRLRGTHRIESAVMPHAGTWEDADLPHVAQAFQACIPCLPVSGDSGSLPPDHVIFTQDDPGLVVTSIGKEDRGIVCRHFRTTDGPAALQPESIRAVGTRDVFGNTDTALPAYRIAETTFTKK